MPGAAVFEAPGRDPVEYALDGSNSVIVMFPAAPGNHIAIAVFHSKPPETPPELEKAVRTRPTGILGLSEVLDMEEEDPPAKTKWWQRLW
jgi:hypothetical protein